MNSLKIGQQDVGPGNPTFIIAELSANHRQRLDVARQIVEQAAEAGADAIKVQTYRPDTLTIDCDNEHFRIQGTAWDGQTLYRLYEQAFMPWDWHRELQALSHSLGMEFFSSPFDESAVDFLCNLNVPAFKVASFELVDIPLLQQIAKAGKPVIASTGMATREEIQLALDTLRRHGCPDIALLKCTSSYPAPPNSMNLGLIAQMQNDFGCIVGLSDHSQGIVAAVSSVALGGSIIEKHLTLSRDLGGPDAGFSLEPDEFRQMVDAVRQCEAMIARQTELDYGPHANESDCRKLRRSIFAIRDIGKGDQLTSENVRSIRPGHGLPTLHLDEILGAKAAMDVPRGTPLQWKHVA